MYRLYNRVIAALFFKQQYKAVNHENSDGSFKNKYTCILTYTQLYQFIYMHTYIPTLNIYMPVQIHTTLTNIDTHIKKS